MHIAGYEFLMEPKESAGSHQILSVQVGSGDETRDYKMYMVQLTEVHGMIYTCYVKVVMRLQQNDSAVLKLFC